MGESEASAVVELTTAYMSPELTGLRLGSLNRQAIEMMAWEGITLTTAAERVGVRSDSLMRAMNRENVKKAYNQLIKSIRQNAGQRAYLKLNHLSDTTESERLRFDANRWIAGVDGISPVQKVQGHHMHNVQFKGFEYTDTAIDVTPATDDASVDTSHHLIEDNE